MAADSLNDKRLSLSLGTSVWRWIMVMVGALFVFNTWAVVWHQWSSPLLLEAPSRAALAAGHWWTLFTYAFTAAGLSTPTQWVVGPLSIFFLFIVAQLVEAEMTRQDFLKLCAFCTLSGSQLWMLLHLGGNDTLLSGCTVLVLGLLSFWCFAETDEPLAIKLFMVFEIRPPTFFWLVLAMETGAFLSFELPQILGHPGAFSGNFDDSAHIGAMIAGAAYASYWRRAQFEDVGLPALPEATPRRAPAVPVGVRRTMEADKTASAAQPTFATRRELREEVDRILDKINHDGLDSLSVQERQTLDQAKNLLKK